MTGPDIGSVSDRTIDDASRVMRCPACGRVASITPWCERPICVHSWDGNTPEVWDGDDPPIEQARNEEFRTPGPKTWTEMVPS